jgi:hypothetical protein
MGVDPLALHKHETYVSSRQERKWENKNGICIRAAYLGAKTATGLTVGRMLRRRPAGIGPPVGALFGSLVLAQTGDLLAISTQPACHVSAAYKHANNLGTLEAIGCHHDSRRRHTRQLLAFPGTVVHAQHAFIPVRARWR